MAKKKRSPAEIAADKRRTGRPRKPADEKQRYRITVYLNKAEWEHMQQLARQEGVSLAELVMRPWREQKEQANGWSSGQT
jgi:hypothetical protein